MIGNRIKYRKYFTYNGETNYNLEEGLVVDAYTKVSGSMSGSGGVFLGFGDSKMSGNTRSDRYYKIQISYVNNEGKTIVYYTDISAGCLHEIVSFANQSQEINEEKIIQ